MGKKYNDVRGLRDFVFSEVETDDGTEYVASEWEQLEGGISADVSYEESYEARYRDNKVIDGVTAEGPDTAVVNMDVLAHKVRAKLEGRTYSLTNDVYVKTPKVHKNLVLGYIKELTDGTEIAVIMYKTNVTAGNDTSNTKTNGTEVTTKEYTFNGVYTNTKFNFGTSEAPEYLPVKSIEVPLKGNVSEADVFGVFTNGTSSIAPLTPDEIIALS